jgi:hypothetical protein
MRDMYVIRLERGSTEADHVVMWLKTMKPQRWGERATAWRFRSKGEARQAAHSIKIVGTWSIEEADEIKM